MKEEIRLIIDFVEGRKSINEFRKDIESNIKLQDLLKKRVDEQFLSYYFVNYANTTKFDIVLLRCQRIHPTNIFPHVT